MYDMSGFDYDIRDVVRILNLQVRRKNPSSYDVDCPSYNVKPLIIDFTGFSLNIYLIKQSQKCMTVIASCTEQSKESIVYKASHCFAL